MIIKQLILISSFGILHIVAEMILSDRKVYFNLNISIVEGYSKKCYLI